MRVLVISGDFPPVRSGEANHAFYLAVNLAGRGHEVHVLTSRIPGVATDGGIIVHPIMGGWGWRDLLRFRGFLKRCRPDAVLLVYMNLMYSSGHPMITFAPTVAKRALPAVRFVTQFENANGTAWPLRRLTQVMRKGVSWWAGRAGAEYSYGTLLRDSDEVIVLSESHRTRLASRYPGLGQKSDLIPPPAIMKTCPPDDEAARRTRQALGADRDAFLLLYYGYIYPGKGFETLLKALQLASRRCPELRLVVCGGFLQFAASRGDGFSAESKDYERRMSELAAELGVADKVTWTGPCPADDDRASLYMHAADACVLPFDQGVHLNNSSVAGVVAHGLPLITTVAPSTEPAFVHGANCLLCPPKGAAELAAAMETVARRTDVRETLRQGAFGLTREWFSLTRVMERTEKALGARRGTESAGLRVRPVTA